MIPRILIFATINLVYGRDTLKTANKFCDAHLKKVRLQETLRFNKKCKKNNILPASLLQPPPTKTRKGFRISENNAKKFSMNSSKMDIEKFEIAIKKSIESGNHFSQYFHIVCLTTSRM